MISLYVQPPFSLPLCAVIDFCMVKQMTTDPETGFDRLVTIWASKAALKQRMGRAGRVSEGRCYRLIRREFYRKYCPTYTVPEMQVMTSPELSGFYCRKYTSVVHEWL